MPQRSPEGLKTYSPGFPQVPFDMANFLADRFLVHHVNNNYEEAKVLLNHLLFPFPLSPCSYRFQAKALTAALKHAW